MSRHNLNAEEVELSRTGPQFADVTPAQLFSASADAVLAARVRVGNPARYWALKQEWEYQTGVLKKPENYYGT
jgi:hypothetical protein